MTGHFADFDDCVEIRHSLGVYVVGAIDPAERSAVETHLAHCQACREELAGLAGLPALLGRVPTADVERLALGEEVPEEEPRPALLDSLLRLVTERQRARRFRLIAAAVAAAVIAVGGGAIGGTVFSHLQSPSSPAAAAPSSADLERGSNPAKDIDASVYYSTQPAGTAMQVQVTGVPAGVPCVFWVITRTGQHVAAGQWTSGASSAEWYTAWTSYNVSQLKGFDVSVNGAVIVTVPLN